MQDIPQSKRSPFVLSNSEDTHTLINDLDMSDSNTKQSNERSQAEIGNERLIEYHDTSDNIGLHILAGYLAVYYPPVFLITFHALQYLCPP
jgi:hypothetical protein